ncbi:4-hydroxythreonine-4-phosphate dehydrogenase PdxA [Compostibacter hankyongensis]|uniref:4-hydroxythreonine-4-phosphate dehydrogenase PdxA n=1 Tax=Compostibacter hankyongensis TaxID=1007089 RepID=A0ABP8FFE0_9BACT
MTAAASSPGPVIGISIGDINGIGPEIVIRTFSDNRILNYCTPVIFASNKTINFYRKLLDDNSFNYQSLKDFQRLRPGQVNIFNCWEEEVVITPGQLNDTGGKYAARSLAVAVQCLKDGQIEGLVTAPIHKKNIQGNDFHFTGHTPYLQQSFGAREVVMLMVAENMRVALVTEHVPVAEVSRHITQESILSKLAVLQDSLVRDFGIGQPRIALLGLNPHAGDEGLVGTEEQQVILPAIGQAKNQGILCFGPYSADAFFARETYRHFDAVLAMYHDQGLIPFKSLAVGEGVNYSAGLPFVRTSPDHGTAFDIAGKNVADAASFREAVFTCAEILRRRHDFSEYTRNPLKKRALAEEG